MYDGLGRLRKRLEYTLICQAGSGTNETEAPSQIESNENPPGNCAWGAPTEVRYIYDGWRVIQERDRNNTPTVSYTRGNDSSVSLEGAGGIGSLLARSVGYSSGNWTSHADYYADGNGNVTSLIDGNQSVVASYRYDPFGNMISKSGSLADANVYRFSSKEVHTLSGIYYDGFRFYDPNLQRWLNRDPILENGGINLYRCLGNSPVNLTDPLGLWSCGEWGQILGDGALGAAEALGRMIKSPVSETAGAAWGWLGLMGGGKLSYGHNSTQIENHPFNNGDITLGHFINYQKGMGPDDPAHDQPGCTYGQHEEAHTHQYEAMGDWFFPTYLSMGIYNEFTGGDWWYDNYLEAGPNSIPPEVFP